VLGVALINVQESNSFVESVFFGLGASAGFALVLVLFSAMRERLEAADVPAPFRGTAIALVTAGIMSLAFMGFAGMARP
jgi:electron transport complex protein RnfA